eukprot:TRINITY_DN23807_c0_g1_i2.p1 TRINITY_DN23807_c0_g1~~TRINITY_DN23807_c0_g1_i2.p1  ORF type:complete len:391 (-),score=17.24 TRINITY_DN23807_c0_g1_i2:271-1443(-)
MSADGKGSDSDETSEETSSNHDIGVGDRSNTVRGLVDHQLPMNVYSTAYILARNASPTMYSFNPLKNHQMRFVWLHLVFLVTSQLFALASVAVIDPVEVAQRVFFVNCNNETQVEELADAGVLASASASHCTDVGDPAFEFQTLDGPVSMRRVVATLHYYENTLGQSRGLSATTVLLQAVCCLWVFAHVYHSDFQGVKALLEYRDFNMWFVVWKGERVTCREAIVIPLAYYAVALCTTCISWCVICGLETPFAIVSNAMAFTFISSVGQFFNQTLLTHYASTRVEFIRPELYWPETYYLVAKYDPDNAVDPDSGKHYADDETWYILEKDRKVGMMTDFHYRMDPRLYEHNTEGIISILYVLFVACPFASLVACYFCVGTEAWKLFHPPSY